MLSKGLGFRDQRRGDRVPFCFFQVIEPCLFKALLQTPRLAHHTGLQDLSRNQDVWRTEEKKQNATNDENQFGSGSYYT